MKKNKHLTARDLFILKKVGKLRLIRAATKVYNNLCPACKTIALRNPRGGFEQYCPTCAKMAEATMAKVNK